MHWFSPAIGDPFFNCAWFFHNDPGCKIYRCSDFGHCEACLKTCGRCDTPALPPDAPAAPPAPPYLPGEGPPLPPPSPGQPTVYFAGEGDPPEGYVTHRGVEGAPSATQTRRCRPRRRPCRRRRAHRRPRRRPCRRRPCRRRRAYAATRRPAAAANEEFPALAASAANTAAALAAATVAAAALAAAALAAALAAAVPASQPTARAAAALATAVAATRASVAAAAFAAALTAAVAASTVAAAVSAHRRHALLTREGYALHALPFGGRRSTTTSAPAPSALLAAPYTYYWHAAFNLSRLHPSGGAIAGGTRLTLYLTDPTLLVDLGGEAHGIFCRFSFSQRSPTTAAALRTEVVVPGALVECGGAEVCGGGGAAIGCEAPAHPCRAACSLTAGVEATINGQDYSDSGAVYAYYDHELHAVHRAHPRGGPQGGGTQLTLRGAAFARGPGPAVCRFGDGALALEAAATVLNDSALNCSVPPLELSAHSCAACATADCWQPPRCRAPGAATSVLASPLSVAVEVSLDGGLTYSRSGVGYAFFDDRLVRVRALTPAGGPRRGGTRVALRADGLRDLGGLRCLFDGEVPSEIRDVSREPSCTAPPDSPAGWGAASRSVAVGVTLNGELNGASVDGAPAFTYYDPDLLRIAAMHPRGGPAAGGTVLHLSLADDALLVDLGGEAHGLLCRFDGTALRRVVVDAAGTPASELASVPVWSTASSPGGVWRSSTSSRGASS